MHHIQSATSASDQSAINLLAQRADLREDCGRLLNGTQMDEARVVAVLVWQRYSGGHVLSRRLVKVTAARRTARDPSSLLSVHAVQRTCASARISVLVEAIGTALPRLWGALSTGVTSIPASDSDGRRRHPPTRMKSEPAHGLMERMYLNQIFNSTGAGG